MDKEAAGTCRQVRGQTWTDVAGHRLGMVARRAWTSGLQDGEQEKHAVEATQSMAWFWHPEEINKVDSVTLVFAFLICFALFLIGMAADRHRSQRKDTLCCLPPHVPTTSCNWSNSFYLPKEDGRDRVVEALTTGSCLQGYTSAGRWS